MSAGPAARPRFLRGALFFLAVFLVYSANGRRIGSNDSTATALTPFALLRGDGLDLERFTGDYFPEDLYCFRRDAAGRLINTYPIGTAILATPLYLPIVFFPDLDPTDGIYGWRAHAALEKHAAAVLAALAALVLLLRLEHDTSPRRALLLAASFALATPVWAVASQSLFGHGATMLLVGGGLLALAPRVVGPGRAAVAGLLAGALVWVRPTSGILGLALAVLAARRGGRTFAAFAVPAISLAATAIGWAIVDFGDWRGGYAQFALPISAAQVPAGVLGLLGGNRGLLFAAPFLPLLCWPWRRPRSLDRWETMGLAGVCVLALAPYAATPVWGSGWSYSGRYTMDLLPVVFLLGAAALEPPLGRVRALALAGLGLAGALSQAVGAFAFPGGESGRSTNVSEELAWSWRRSATYLAAQAGAAPPELFPMTRFGAQRALPADGRRAEVWLERRLPARWQRNSRFPARIRVTNRGRRTWPAWGSYGGEFATRLVVTWRHTRKQRWEMSEFSLGGDLAPGASRVLEVQLLAPEVTGRWEVEIGVAERGAYGPVMFRDGPASTANVLVKVKPAEARAFGRLDWPPPRGAEEAQ